MSITMFQVAALFNEAYTSAATDEDFAPAEVTDRPEPEEEDQACILNFQVDVKTPILSKAVSIKLNLFELMFEMNLDPYLSEQIGEDRVWGKDICS